MSDFRIRIRAELDAKNFTSQLDALKKNKVKIPVELDLKNSNLQKALSGLSGKNPKIKPDVDISGIQKGKTAVEGLKTSMAQLQKFQFKIDTQGALADVKNIESQIKRLNSQISDGGDTTKLKAVTEAYEKLSNIQQELQSKRDLGIGLDESDLTKYNTALKETQNQIKILKADLSDTVSATSRIKLTSDIQTWLNNNTQATKAAKEELQSYIDQLNSAGNSLTKGQFNTIANGYKQITAQMTAQGNIGKSWIDDFKRAFSQITQFAGAYGVIQNVIFDVPRQMVQAVRDVNAAQIELRKVSDASNSQLTAYWDEAAISAQKYGAAINEVINSTADWQRLGYSFEDSKELSDLTTLIQRVGDNMTQQTSSEGLISTIQGFQLAADEAQKVVDITNEVANTQPIDTAGIFSGLQRSASTMSAANNTLEETIALITAGNAVLQDPERVGNGLKTISMRIRGATTELEAAGESTEGMAESTAALRKEVMALAGVDIMENDTTFKSTYQILDELSTKWSDLTDIQQANSCLYAQKCA